MEEETATPLDELEAIEDEDDELGDAGSLKTSGGFKINQDDGVLVRGSGC
jgi:hypothetical protein